MKPGPPFVPHHKRERSQYYEGEVHSSQASIPDDDLPSARLDASPRLEPKKSLHTYGGGITGYTSNNRNTPNGGSR